MSSRYEFAEVNGESQASEIRRIIGVCKDRASFEDKASEGKVAEFFEVFEINPEDFSERKEYAVRWKLNSLTNGFLKNEKNLLKIQRSPLPKQVRAKDRMTQRRRRIAEQRAESYSALTRAIILLFEFSFEVEFENNKFIVKR